jgi:hypothetical protein
MADGDVVAEEVNLFERRQPEIKKPFTWQPYPELRRAVLRVGGHSLEVWRESADGPYIYANTTSWRSDFAGQTWDRDEAKAACEAEARKLIYGPWANDPASEKQIRLLARNKIQFRPNITKAEAKELLQPLFDRIERAKKARVMA